MFLFQCSDNTVCEKNNANNSIYVVAACDDHNPSFFSGPEPV